MRKHSVRKWIHAICDLLPLLVIPIFALAVRSDNNFQPIEVNYGGGYEVTPLYESNELNTFDDLQVGHLYHYDRYFGTHEDYNYISNFTMYIVSGNLWSNGFELDEIYVDDYFNNVDNYIRLDWYDDNTFYITISNKNGYVAVIQEGNSTFSFNDFDFYFSTQDDLDGFIDFYIDNYDDDIIHSDIKPSTYQDYSVVYHEGQVYNDTDVGSQMMYTLYQTTDKYFNFNNVGVFQDLYNWFETNMFHGTAPMSFYIVWNVILFELIMDLIFLTYMVFMFIIDFTECMIDRFFEKSYRGGR